METPLLSSDMKRCLICFNEESEFPVLCEYCPSLACQECAQNYISNKIKSSILGVCPRIPCPLYCKKFLSFKNWSVACNESDIRKYFSLARSLLSIQCAGCHIRQSLCASDLQKDNSFAVNLNDALSTTEVEDLLSRLTKFDNGEIPTTEIYSFVLSIFNIKRNIRDYEDLVWKTITNSVLPLIHDPERKINILLFHLYKHPQVKTPCCKLMHCFRCKTKRAHTADKCEAIQLDLDNSIVTCPQCHISIVKGDGCDTVTCLCGHTFVWSQRKVNLIKSKAFYEKFPCQTELWYARIICNSYNSSVTSIMEEAFAWATLHDNSSNGLPLWWNEAHPFPSQSCALYLVGSYMNNIKNQLSKDCIHDAAIYWRSANETEVNFRLQENKLAKNSLFTTLYPEQARAAVAYQIIESKNKNRSYKVINNNFNDFMICDIASSPDMQSAAIYWAKSADNLSKIQRERVDCIWRDARRFLYLYGNIIPKRQKECLASIPNNFSYDHSCLAFPNIITHFDKSLSNDNLLFENFDKTCFRPNAVSVYPAAFAVLPSYLCSFSCVLDFCPLSSNWLTIGLARKKTMTPSFSWGFGRSSGSWGLCDHRDGRGMPEEIGFLSVDGSKQSYFRQLVKGDIITLIADLKEGWLDIHINSPEFTYRFNIPTGSPDDYIFGVTLADNHQISLIETKCAVAERHRTPVLGTTTHTSPMLNDKTSRSFSMISKERILWSPHSNHINYYDGFNSCMKMITSSEETESDFIHKETQELSDAWEAKHNGDSDSTLQNTLLLTERSTVVDEILGLYQYRQYNGILLLADASFSAVFQAMCWRKLHSEQYQQYTIRIIHRETSPFKMDFKSLSSMETVCFDELVE